MLSPVFVHKYIKGNRYLTFFLILFIQPIEGLRLLFSALFLLIISKHFKQNIFLWPSKIVWSWWMKWGWLLGSA